MAKTDKTVPDGSIRIRADLKSGNFARCYVFYGEEAYLRNYYLDQLRSKILDGPAEAFNSHFFDSKSFSVQALSDAIDALPVMAERTWIQVEDVALFQLEENDRVRLSELLAELPDYLCMVFSYCALEFKTDKRQKLGSAIEKNCVQLHFPRQSQSDLAAWCQRHFHSAGKRISKEACDYLIFQTDGTMTSLKSEIEKLTLYVQGPEITREDIAAVVSPVLNAQVFAISDALAERNFEQAVKKLQEILQLQQEPIQVLAAIAVNMRRMLAAKVLEASRMGMSEFMHLYPDCRDYYARKVMSSARKFSLDWCEKAVCLCAQTDYQLKTSGGDKNWLIELLILHLVEGAR